MPEMGRSFYRPAPGIDVVPLGNGALLFLSDTHAARIEGASTTFFRERILPLLDGSRSLADVAAVLPSLDPDELSRQLDGLADAGLLERGDQPLAWQDSRMGPLLALLQAAGLPLAESRERLAGLRVAVVGLEGAGAHAAVSLAACGVGELVLVDPFPCQPGNLALMPPLMLGADALGRPRDQVLKQLLEGQGAGTRVAIGIEVGAGIGDASGITSEALLTLARTCHLLIGAVDKGLSVANRWVNRASLTHDVPAIFCQLAGHVAVVGPLVVPGQSACWACWRRRTAACADSYPEATAYEDFLDQQRQSRLHQRPALPALAAYAGSLVALEVVKLLLGVPAGSGAATLVGRVHEFDGLRFHSDTHPLLRVPDCPECGDRPRQSQPSPATVWREDTLPGGVLTAAGRLVSPRCGVITDFGPIAKGPGEPVQPYLFGGRLANYARLADRAADDGIFSGKGLTFAAAQASALGEAVECYAGTFRSADHVRYASRRALDEPSLDPAELVLYRPEQYSRLPYAPYADSAVLGWMAARSLLSGSAVLVPALAAFLDYPPRAPEENLCPTSSTGLAAGATLAEAVLAALYEVLERDAFMVTWLNRLPAGRVDPATHPDPELVDLYYAYARRGVALRLYHLAVDHPCHVFLCLALQRRGEGWPAAAAGLGADLDPAKAASKALLEAGQIRTGLLAASRDPSERARAEQLLADPRLVATLDDHALRYIHPGAIGAFAFLERGREAPCDWTAPLPASASDRLRLLAEHFRTNGGDVLYCDLTTVDLTPLGLHVARVIVPGFQPLHFGQEPRLGGRRLYELPWQLGFTAAPTTPASLNDDPHPLA